MNDSGLAFPLLGLRERSFLLSLLLVTLAVFGSMAVAERQLERELVSKTEAQLASMAEVAALAARELAPAKLDGLADEVGRASGMRITFIAESGQVFGDSDPQVTDIAVLQSHSDRPEVQAAQADGAGAARRHSTTIGVDMVYVARRAPLAGGVGVVRCAMPLLDLERAIDALRMAMLAAGLLSLIIVSAVSWLASVWLARPLRALVQSARRVSSSAAGNQHDEVGALSYRLQDLTMALQRSVEGLTQERDRLDQLLAAMTEAVVAFDDQQQVMLMNPAARALWGPRLNVGSLVVAPQATDVGHSSPSFPEGKELADLVRHAAGGQPGSLEMSVAVGGMRARQVAVRATAPVGSIGVVLIAVDVTEVRRLETLRRDFVANVSHELRTPCSVILANTETLMAGAIHDPARANRFLEAINRHADRLHRLIADVLDLSRIEAGQQAFSKGPVVLSGVIAEVLKALESRVSDKGHLVTVNIADDAVVRGDDKALEQVFINLLDNAFRYTPAGGHVRVSSTMDGDDVVVTVQDDGPGVDPKHLSRLFERFYRADRGRSRDAGGTGLGLAIVKHLTEGMDGTVTVDVAIPHGLCFHVRLPTATGSSP